MSTIDYLIQNTGKLQEVVDTFLTDNGIKSNYEDYELDELFPNGIFLGERKYNFDKIKYKYIEIMS